MNVASQIVVHTTVHTDDLAATILGTLGVVLALGSLAWQAFTFFSSGSRIKVVLRAGATDGLRVVTTAGAPSGSHVSQLQSQGLTQPVYGIEVLNSGRGPTSIQSVDVLFDNGAVYTGAYVAGSPTLPCRMEGESEKTWLVDATYIDSYAKGFHQYGNPPGQPQVVRGQVKLGGKKRPVVSKNEIQVL